MPPPPHTVAICLFSPLFHVWELVGSSLCVFVWKSLEDDEPRWAGMPRAPADWELTASGDGAEC